LECPLKKFCSEKRPKTPSQRTVEEEFKEFKHFVDPEYQKFESFFEHRRGSESSSSANAYNVNNDTKNQSVQIKSQHEKTQGDVKAPTQTSEEKDNAAIDEAIRQLAHIVGELEFQMGIESAMTGHYNDAFTHFKLSTSHNHPGGVFNLALCYEQGVGVKRNMKTARKLYEVASGLGHAKASYNLGVFHAQGLGGAHKSFNQAKKYFEQAAEMGNSDAIEALRLLLPPSKRLPIIEEVPDEEFYFKDKSMMSPSAIANRNIMRRVAVS
jgi:TPR repeat protein